MPDRLALIVELEARQDEALRQLIELDERVETVLREVAPALAAPNGTGTAAMAHPHDPSSETRPATLVKAA